MPDSDPNEGKKKKKVHFCLPTQQYSWEEDTDENNFRQSSRIKSLVQKEKEIKKDEKEDREEQNKNPKAKNLAEVLARNTILNTIIKLGSEPNPNPAPDAIKVIENLISETKNSGREAISSKKKIKEELKLLEKEKATIEKELVEEMAKKRAGSPFSQEKIDDHNKKLTETRWLLKDKNREKSKQEKEIDKAEKKLKVLKEKLEKYRKCKEEHDKIANSSTPSASSTPSTKRILPLLNANLVTQVAPAEKDAAPSTTRAADNLKTPEKPTLARTKRVYNLNEKYLFGINGRAKKEKESHVERSMPKLRSP